MPREMRVNVYEQFKGSTYTYEIDLTVLDQELSVTSSAATWSTTDSSTISLGTSSFASKVASCPITASSVGVATVKLSITTGSNDAPVYFFKIHVLDPEDDYTNTAWR